MPAIVGTDTEAVVRCAVFKIDLKGKLVYIDDETEELSGFSREELFGKSLYDFVPEDCRHLLDNIINRPKRHDLICQAWPLVLRTSEKERQEFRAVVTLNFIGDLPANYQFILIPPLAVPATPAVEEIPGRPLLPPFGDRLSLLGQAADALQLGIAVVDDAFAFVYANDFLTRTMTPEGGTFPDDLRGLWQALQPVHLSGEAVSFDDCDIIRAIHERRFSACHGRSGLTGGLMTMATAPLQTISPALAVVLCIGETVTAGAAESRIAAARKLITTMAHDLRAPLITMEAFSRRLSSDHGGQLDDRGRFALSCLAENARIMHKMIDGLGELAANWAAGQKVERVSLRELVDDLVTMLRATYPETEYTVEYDGYLPALDAPKVKLAQVFRNILDNAFKYSAAAAKPHITVAYTRDNGWHRFFIADNGPGIDPRYRDKIFEPFFRTPEAATGAIPGTGMGLTIVHDIVTGWGGYIRYESPADSPAGFVFGFPGRIEG
jgi:signal transduction histidine kinase